LHHKSAVIHGKGPFNVPDCLHTHAHAYSEPPSFSYTHKTDTSADIDTDRRRYTPVTLSVQEASTVTLDLTSPKCVAISAATSVVTLALLVRYSKYVHSLLSMFEINLCHHILYMYLNHVRGSQNLYTISLSTCRLCVQISTI